LTGLPADAFEHEQGAGEAPAFPAKTPDIEELRKREREMHRAQMRADAQAREEAAKREREARGEFAGKERDAGEPAKGEPVPAAPQAVEPRAVASEPAESRPVVPQPAAPRVDTREMLESAGLQMVETRSDRVPAVQAEPEAVHLGRPRRERPRPSAEEQQLVQVETKP
jgi:hypothetical protein